MRRLASSITLLCVSLLLGAIRGRATARQEKTQTAPPTISKSGSAKLSPPNKPPSPADELQQAIADAGNDRAALVRNLEAFLKKYPDSPQRPQIYRALVEASLQIRDSTRAASYAERLVSLTPEDMSISLLAIQLLERNGDEPALRRAVSYATRVLEFVDRGSLEDKSPQISTEEWQMERKRDRMSILLLRGRLCMKLQDNAAARKDLETSYSLLPNAAAAEKLGEIAELNKQPALAIPEYARAFALAEGAKGSVSRREIRQKLGNVWRLVHGSEEGLGNYLLRNYDEVAQATDSLKTSKNNSAREPFEFTLRKAPEGTEFPLANTKGKILVVNFWATWCGPCRTLEPQFERVASQFLRNADVTFLAANCDEDETLVQPYLEEEKLRVTTVFADGLDRLLSVDSFPTVVVIDRAGKIVYRATGYRDDSFEKELTAAVRQALENAPAANITSSH